MVTFLQAAYLSPEAFGWLPWDVWGCIAAVGLAFLLWLAGLV